MQSRVKTVIAEECAESSQVKAEHSASKAMATVSWIGKGVIRVDIAEGNRTFMADYYRLLLQRFHATILRKWTVALHNKIWFHLDNAHVNSSTPSVPVLREFCVGMLRHQPYNLDFAPSDLLFPNLSHQIKGHR